MVRNFQTRNDVGPFAKSVDTDYEKPAGSLKAAVVPGKTDSEFHVNGLKHTSPISLLALRIDCRRRSIPFITRFRFVMQLARVLFEEIAKCNGRKYRGWICSSD